MRARLTPTDREAARWLARRDRGFTPEEEKAFRQWCSEPANAEAAGQLAGMWSALNRPADRGKAPVVEFQVAALVRRSRRRKVLAFSSVLAAAACAVLLLRVPTNRPPPGVPAEVASDAARIVQPERRVLPDGTVVELREGAEISVDYEEAVRRVFLAKGEALFEVAKNPGRPFVVTTAGLEVRDVGTTFDIDLSHGPVDVVVTEGRVILSQLQPEGEQIAKASVPLAYLDAGKRALVQVSTGGGPHVTMLQDGRIDERLSWRVPRLDFTNATLEQAAELFNRSNRKKILVGGDLSNLRVSGVFRSDNVEGFVKAVESTLGVRAREKPDQSVLLERM
jgi:transmembrane sensor